MFWIQKANASPCVHSMFTGSAFCLSVCAYPTPEGGVLQSTRREHPTGCIIVTQKTTRDFTLAIAMNSRAHSILTSWEKVSPRRRIARFEGTPFDMTVISVYAPTVKAERSVKDAFYRV